eukprot:805045-Prorocentrum_minimum.AAC.4
MLIGVNNCITRFFLFFGAASFENSEAPAGPAAWGGSVGAGFGTGAGAGSSCSLSLPLPASESEP